MAERSKDWLDQALRDLNHARHDIEDEFYEWACFSSQQAAEMAVKAVFQRLAAEAWGHAIADLLRLLPPQYTVSDELMASAMELDRAYIPTRYPDAHPSGAPGSRYGRSDAENMVQHASRIVRFCEDILAAL